MKYKTTYDNGCKDPKTLELFNRFFNNNHCLELVMFMPNEDSDKETVALTFNHYGDHYEVLFDPLTLIGTVRPMMGMFMEEASEVEEVFITVEKLEALFKTMPHLMDFVESNAGILH